MQVDRRPPARARSESLRLTLSMVLRSQVEQLLLTSIDSVEQCEILVTMRDSSERWWTAKDLALEVYLSESPTSRDLEILITRGLLDVRIAHARHYRLAPVSLELAQAVTDLAEAYRTTRVEVLSYIVRRKGRAFKHFAEAFNFRKDR